MNQVNKHTFVSLFFCFLLLIPGLIHSSASLVSSDGSTHALITSSHVINKVMFIGRIMNKTTAVDPHYGNITAMFFRRVLCLQYYRDGLRYAFVVVRYHNWRMAFQMDYYDVKGYIGERFICTYFNYKGK